MSLQFCRNCGHESLVDIDPASGATICTSCGTVLEDSQIVSEITFTETASGVSRVDGQLIQADSTRHFRFIPGTRTESREITLEKANRRLKNLADQLRISSRIAESAHRLYALALQRNFTRGRKANYVAAACLYICCRLEKTAHMLLDFAEALEADVFLLGHTFVQLIRTLKIDVPLVEPWLYIRRFAAKLEFGSKNNAVVHFALKLVARMKRDWIQTGRRPAGLCAAALLISARIHGFRRSQEEVVRIVRICGATLSKRLKEFDSTPTAEMTPEEFEKAPEHGESECDPPAFQRAEKMREEAEKIKQLKEEREKMIEKELEKLAEKEKLEKEKEMKEKPVMTKEFLESEKPNEKKESDKKEIKEEPKKLEKEEKTEISDTKKVAEKKEEITDFDTEEAVKEMVDVLQNNKELQQVENDLNYENENQEKFLFDREDELKDEPEEKTSKALSDDDGDLDKLNDEELDKYIVKDEGEIKLREEIWDELNGEYLLELERRQKEREEKEKERQKEGKEKKKRKPKKKEPEEPAKSAHEAMARAFKKRQRPIPGVDIDSIFGIETKVTIKKEEKVERPKKKKKVEVQVVEEKVEEQEDEVNIIDQFVF